MKLQYITRKHTCHVELRRDTKCQLGISITDSQKYKGRPVIKRIKHGSLSQKSHSLAVGDVVVAVRGQDCRGLSKKDVKRLLKMSYAEDLLDIEVEYFIKEACFGYCRIYCSQRMFLNLRKEGGTFGFVLRKNEYKRAGAAEYPIISNIKQGGPADKEGSLMTGDRLLEVDNQSLSWLSLNEVAMLLQEKDEAVFLIEYNVGIIDLSREKAIELEIDCPGANLGIRVSNLEGSRMCIASIQQGSLAQRCGAFHVGDEILRINGLDVSSMTVLKANEFLRNFKKAAGKLTFVHHAETAGQGMETQSCDISQMESTINHSNTDTDSPNQSSVLFAPPNSPTSSHYNPIQESTFFKSAGNNVSFNDNQLKTISILRDINFNLENLKLRLLQGNQESSKHFLDTNSTGDASNNMASEHLKTDEQLHAQLQTQLQLVQNLNRELTFHVIETASQLDASSQFSAFRMDNPEALSIRGGVVSELVDSLDEIALLEMTHKHSAGKLISSASKVSTNCSECQRNCYSASFAVRKILLLFSLRHPTLQEVNVIRSVMERVSQLCVPCEACEKDTGVGVQKEQPDLKSRNISMPLRSLGVGASSSSSGTSDTSSEIDSKSSKQNGQAKLSPIIGLDTVHQTAVYKLKQLCSEEMEEGLNSEVNASETLDQIQRTYNSQFLRKEEKSSAAVSQRVPKERVVDSPKSQNSSSAFVNKRNKISSFSESIRSSKSPEIISKSKRKLNHTIPTTRTRSANSADIPIQVSHLKKNNDSCGFDLNCSQQQDSQPTAESSFWTNCANTTQDRSDGFYRKKHPETHEVMLKADDKISFGLALGYSSILDEVHQVPIITAIKPGSSAQKTGLLKKGDRILGMNGFSTMGMSVSELERFKREIFSFDEVVLKVEFDVNDTEITWGTFSIQLKEPLKLGLIMNVPDKPSMVKGLVKGTSAHRSGQIVPGDEILSFTSFREENLNLETWIKTKYKTYRLTVRRPGNLPLKIDGEQQDISSEPVSHLKNTDLFHIKRASIRTLENMPGNPQFELEQELTLFRDPQSWDFGFLLGENPTTGQVYITDIRLGGPADSSRLIKKNDRILEVNGVRIDGKTENTAMNLFMQTDDHVDLTTRRLLNYK